VSVVAVSPQPAGPVLPASAQGSSREPLQLLLLCLAVPGLPGLQSIRQDVVRISTRQRARAVHGARGKQLCTVQPSTPSLEASSSTYLTQALCSW
jgi:hypothetical protein